ncbi:hypothetical protein GGS23DRAFT_363076 [Durotheca rogersii]|uniref:uncharacterized protein n=1 Tax=Durotheca rogersii TaxID=419775 RepID=UPI0022208DBF|nr:uncharacterized protein GGS23DRAFT_363076 [Durotheca rogersii]KAI5865975.1 hypothetical protein GGS23DRAFT_363076 [Durotheca rogersii]
MDGRTGRSMDAGYAIPGGFPAYPEPPRPSSRPATARDSEAETMSVSRTTSMPIPPKGILKKAKPPPPPPRPQDPLAARFYRIPRPEQMHPLSPPESPTYPSDNNSYSGDFDTDSQSTSSNLSSNTQATSVISDAPSKPSRPSTLVRHVRHAPLHTNRVRSRPRSSKAPSESGRSSVSKSSVGKSSAHSTKSKRTIHIQFVPSTTNTATANTAVPRNSPSQSKELQLARRPDRSLVRKLEQLESETETLRRDLDDASTQLTTRGQQNMEIVRALNLERNTKELILRDLHEQRRISDDFRVDFQLQQDELRKVEKDRDSLRYSRDKLEKQVAMLERELAERDADRHHHEDELRHDIDVLESTTTNLERQVDSRDRELREVLIERDTAWDESRRLQAQVKALETDRVPFKKFREAMDEKESLRGQINNARGEKAALDEKVRGIEQEIEVLKRKIAELEHDKQALESDKQALESDKRALQSDKEALQAELSDKQTQIDGLTAEPTWSTWRASSPSYACATACSRRTRNSSSLARSTSTR